MKLEKVIAVRNSKTIYRDGSYVIKVFDEGDVYKRQRTRLKTPHGCVVFFVAHCAISAFLPSRASHFVGFALFIARVSDWHQIRHPNPGKTPHSCAVFFVAQCAISSVSLIANSMFNGGRDFCYPYILKEKKPSFGTSPKETCSLPIPKTPVPLLELSPAL